MKNITQWFLRTFVYHIKQKKVTDCAGDIHIITFIGFDPLLKIKRKIPYFNCEGFTSEHIAKQRAELDLIKAEEIRDYVMKRNYPKLFK